MARQTLNWSRVWGKVKTSTTARVQTLFIEPGSPWGNGYVESFNGKLRDELLDDREIFYTLIEAQVLVQRWRREYNWKRPHSSLGYRPPAPVAIEGCCLKGRLNHAGYDTRSGTISGGQVNAKLAIGSGFRK